MRRLILLAALSLAACGNDPYRGVYEGIKNHNESMKTPEERRRSPTPDYDQYKRERDSHE